MAAKLSRLLTRQNRMIALYAEHCGQDPETVERTLDRDTFFTAEQARDWGLLMKSCRAAPRSDAAENGKVSKTAS